MCLRNYDTVPPALTQTSKFLVLNQYEFFHVFNGEQLVWVFVFCVRFTRSFWIMRQGCMMSENWLVPQSWLTATLWYQQKVLRLEINVLVEIWTPPVSHCAPPSFMQCSSPGIFTGSSSCVWWPRAPTSPHHTCEMGDWTSDWSIVRRWEHLSGAGMNWASHA